MKTVETVTVFVKTFIVKKINIKVKNKCKDCLKDVNYKTFNGQLIDIFIYSDYPNIYAVPV